MIVAVFNVDIWYYYIRILFFFQSKVGVYNISVSRSFFLFVGNDYRYWIQGLFASVSSCSRLDVIF